MRPLPAHILALAAGGLLSLRLLGAQDGAPSTASVPPGSAPAALPLPQTTSQTSSPETDQTEPAPGRISLLLQLTGPEGLDTARYADALAVALMRSASILSVSRSTAHEDRPLIEEARQQACPLIMKVRLSETGPTLQAEWELSSTLGVAAPAAGSFAKRVPTEDELASSFWVDSVNAAEAFAAQIKPSSLTLSARPGSVIEGFGETFVMPKEGSLKLALILPARIDWIASAPGQMPEQGIYLAARDGQKLAIPQRRWSVEPGVYGFAFPELRAAYALDPRFFARASLSQFLFGISLQNPNEGVEQPLSISYPLVQIGLGAGYYSAPAIRPFRSYATLDLFARFFFPEGRGIYLEPVAPIGLQPAAGFEWGQGPFLRLFLEVGAVFYPWANPGLMVASIGENSNGSLVFGGRGWFKGHPGWVLELPITRVGLRFRL